MNTAHAAITTKVGAAACAAALSAMLALSGCASGAPARASAGASQAKRMEVAHELAWRAYQQEDPIKAQQQYLQALDQYSSFTAAWNNLGVLLLNDGRLNEAEEAFTAASRLDQTDPRPEYNRAIVWHQLNRTEPARHHYQRALDRDPNYLPALRGLVRVDVVDRTTDERTLDLIDRALLLEQDETMQQTLQLQRLRIEQKLDEQPGL